MRTCVDNLYENYNHECHITISGKDYYVQIRIMGQGDWKYEMSSVESQAFQDVREKVYDCVRISVIILQFSLFNHLKHSNDVPNDVL